MRLDAVLILSLMLAVLFTGTLGAFFLYVPALSVMTVVALLSGLCLMLALGILIGSRWRKLSIFAHPVRRIHGLTVVR